MQITKRPFGTLADGTAVTAYTMTNDAGLQTEILDYGVTIRTLLVPDKNGDLLDVVLGYDTLEEYVAHDSYLGATIGRFGNRIGGAAFELNGKEYHVPANNGVNSLHGGNRGFDKYVWDVKETAEGLEFFRISPDGEEGYPGTLQVTVTLSWKGNGLELRYHAETDQDTILNLTNHSYFNLNGGGTIYDQVMMLNADRFNMNDAGCLPTGELVPVENTAMDFRTPHPIGDAIHSDEPCVKLSGGYDSNYVLCGNPAAVVTSPKTGITMTVTTDQPGVQFYSGNVLTHRAGKNGATYDIHGAFCLETQHYPDSIHHPEWPTCILKAGEAFDSATKYEFTV